MTLIHAASFLHVPAPGGLCPSPDAPNTPSCIHITPSGSISLQRAVCLGRGTMTTTQADLLEEIIQFTPQRSWSYWPRSSQTGPSGEPKGFTEGPVQRPLRLPVDQTMIGEWACYPNLRRHHGDSSTGSCSNCSYCLRASHNPIPILTMPRKRTAVG